jgi:hypothetical protein
MYNFIVEYFPEDGQKKAETCSRSTTCLHVAVVQFLKCKMEGMVQVSILSGPKQTGFDSAF